MTGSGIGVNIEKIVNFGFVGEPYKIDTDILSIFEDSDVIPVIAPIGVGENGETYNINADTAAGHIAAALIGDIGVLSLKGETDSILLSLISLLRQCSILTVSHFSSCGSKPVIIGFITSKSLLLF